MARQGELFVLTRAPARAIEQALLPLTLSALLGRGLFPLHNWHQSLSDRHPPQHRDALIRTCEQLQAAAFELRLDRFGSPAGAKAPIHCRAFPADGNPDGLLRLLAALRLRTASEGLIDPHRHAAHVTMSYRAPQAVPVRAMSAVDWRIDTIELVEVAGTGQVYRYETIYRKTLQPGLGPVPSQRSLFV